MVFKKQLFTVNYSITNYNEASDIILEKALSHTSFGVTALAVHGLIETVKSESFKNIVNSLDMIVPDGQPLKWALNSFYKLGLKDRVAGPILTRYVLEKANEASLSIYLYGSTGTTLEKMKNSLSKNYPFITIAGMHSDRFRDATIEEDRDDIKKINESGAHIILVGRGCPRQEKWVANHINKIKAPMMAIGAAFDFIAGNIKHAPQWMKNAGLEWFYRFIQDPKRLWKRYLSTNLYFIYLVVLCKLGVRKVQF